MTGGATSRRFVQYFSILESNTGCFSLFTILVVRITASTDFELCLSISSICYRRRYGITQCLP